MNDNCELKSYTRVDPQESCENLSRTRLRSPRSKEYQAVGLVPRCTAMRVATVNERYGKCASASNRTLSPTGLESRTGLTQGTAYAPMTTASGAKWLLQLGLELV